MDPGRPSKRARLGPHLNSLSHVPGTNLQSQPSATSANQPNPQAPTPAPSASKHTGSFRPKNPFKALAKFATVIPPLQPVVDLLAESIDSLSISSENSQDYDTFSANITKTIETLKLHLNSPNLVSLTESISNTIEELKKQAEYISKKQGRSGGKRLMDAERDEADLMRCYRNVNTLLRQLNIDIGVTVSRISQDTLGVASSGLDVARAGLDVTNQTFKLINEHLPDARLAEMSPVKEARYDSGATEVSRSGCTPNTRMAILKELVGWANDANGPKVYWMNGMAGTGKTTIAHSFCERLDDTNQLAASFFCSRYLPGCRDPTRIVPTIAYQLARLFRPYHDALCPAIINNPDIGTTHIKKQFKKLIWEPLRAMNQAVPPGRFVFVIDALDECSDPTRAHYFADELLQCPPDSPIKFFITCRPDPILNDRLSTMEQASRSIFHLHDIEESLIQDDIETYLNDELRSIGVTEGRVKLLAKRSGKLFIYAATVVRYVRPKATRVNSLNRLEFVLSTMTIPSSKVHASLDDLYGSIVSAAMGNKELEPREVKNIKLVLYTVLCAREPLSIQTLACLLGLEGTKEAELAVEPLQSVLHVSDSQKLVTTLHASFPDYMHDHERSGNFWCDAGTHQGVLARQCFDTMENLLRFNICSLESSFVRDSDVPDLTRRIEEAIPSHLFYACKYWSEHSVRAHNVAILMHMLKELLANRVLFWMEVMNLKGCIELGASILSEVYGWMKRAGVSDDACALCIDALLFATAFGASPARTSTPHIYVSILALWNRDSAMWAQYGTQMKGLAVAEQSALNNRESGPLASWSTGSYITSAAVSHDGRRVATSSGDELQVWGTYTGTLLAGPFIGHTGEVLSVAFSPDDSRIASASYDRTLRVWNVYTGYVLGAPFEGHQSAVSCVAFSPDGSRLASGSDDCTIRIWDTQTGQTVTGSRKEHTSWVCSIAYAPDGGCIVSRSIDGTICIWDPQTAHMIMRPLEGSQSEAFSNIAFSPDGSLFASGFGSDDIRVWGTESGRMVRDLSSVTSGGAHSIAFNPAGNNVVFEHVGGGICVWDMEAGHQVNEYSFVSEDASVQALAYLANGYHIFFALNDGTICIWNTQARKAHSNAAVEQVGSPVHSVRSVNFSPDSRRIASGRDDGIICIWDVHAGNALVGRFQTGITRVNCVAFSSDGSRIASSVRHVIDIWDTRTGRKVVGPLEGHTGWVRCVAYSPDGSRFVSGSYDRTVRVWDSQTGRALGGPFEGHTSAVTSVAFSPDGKRVVSGSHDHTVLVWDAHVGQTVVGPLRGHGDWVCSVAFSPNGRHIMSGSHDCTIRVWDAQTGHAIGEPFKGHTERVSSVAYSPNGSLIVSGSFDYTVRVWDAETGCTVAGPFKAHTKEVTSVAYSPDGNWFASGSGDGTIRIWRSRTDSDDVDPLENWTVNGDGWVVGGDLSLLFWVPQDLRPALMLPQNTVFIRSQGVLRFTFHDACVGSWWTECFPR